MSGVEDGKVGRILIHAAEAMAIQEPMQGLPAIMKPVWMKVMAGSWLMASVCMERMRAISVSHLSRPQRHSLESES